MRNKAKEFEEAKHAVTKRLRGPGMSAEDLRKKSIVADRAMVRMNIRIASMNMNLFERLLYRLARIAAEFSFALR